MERTIFDKLRTMQTEGKALRALIVDACDAGDALVASIDPPNVRKAALLLIGHGHGLHGGLLNLMADSQDRALDRAFRSNGDTPTNGAKAA